jgi:SH3 domain-containing protein
MSCSRCGAQAYHEEQRFCGNCGARLIDREPLRPDALAFAEPNPSARPEWPSRTPEPARFKKPLIIAAVIVLIVVLAGAGVFFALLRPAGKEEIAGLDQPVDRPAEPKSSSDSPPPPQEEAPGPKTQATPKNSPPARARPSAPASSTRRPRVAGTYEAVRDTPVYESPAASSRVVASIPRGFKVTVVGSTGNWLEVRSTSGRPPGFIRRSDALPRERLS